MSFLLSRFLKNLNIRFILVSFLSLDFRHIQRNNAVFVEFHISHIAVFPFQIFLPVGHTVRDFQLVPFDDRQADFREKAAGESDEFLRQVQPFDGTPFQQGIPRVFQPIDVALGHGLRRSGLENLGTAVLADDGIPFFHDFGNGRLELTSF